MPDECRCRPPKLESFIAHFIPPACREELLGDLCEKYSNPLQYCFLAARTIPYVILSRFRRINGPWPLLTDPLLIYGAFLLEAWHGGALSHADPTAYLRLAVPAALTWIYAVARDAFAPAAGQPAAFEPGFIVMLVVMSIVDSIWGFCSALLLLSLMQLFLPWSPNPRRTQFVNSRISWVAAAGFTAPYVLLHFSGPYFRIAAAILFVIVIGYSLLKRRGAKPGSRRDPL